METPSSGWLLRSEIMTPLLPLRWIDLASPSGPNVYTIILKLLHLLFWLGCHQFECLCVCVHMCTRIIVLTEMTEKEELTVFCLSWLHQTLPQYSFQILVLSWLPEPHLPKGVKVIYFPICLSLHGSLEGLVFSIYLLLLLIITKSCYYCPYINQEKQIWFLAF